MYLLDSRQILSAVQLSLEKHVLPVLTDDFARVQVQSALKALAEVAHRLEHGDPCEQLNARIESGTRELAASLVGSSSDFGAALSAALEAAADHSDPRERARALGEALWKLVAESSDPAAARLLALLREQALRMASEDGGWICGEAIASLT